jgi:phage terminase Nu1 subunit (DNA packaging protein)
MSVSQRQYAAHRKRKGLPGSSHTAVANAVREGRLTGAIDSDGQIADVDLADKLWAVNTLADRVPLSGPTTSAVTSLDLPAARARREMALAQIAELDLAERRGELIAVDQARADVEDLISNVRTRLLGVPSQLAQRDRSITPEQVDLVETLIREALSELADDDDDDDDEDG